MEGTVDLIGFCMIAVGPICIGIPLTKLFLAWTNRKKDVVPPILLIAPFKAKIDEIISSGILNKRMLPVYLFPLIHLDQVASMENNK